MNQTINVTGVQYASSRISTWQPIHEKNLAAHKFGWIKSRLMFSLKIVSIDNILWVLQKMQQGRLFFLLCFIVSSHWPLETVWPLNMLLSTVDQQASTHPALEVSTNLHPLTLGDIDQSESCNWRQLFDWWRSVYGQYRVTLTKLKQMKERTTLLKHLS